MSESAAILEHAVANEYLAVIRDQATFRINFAGRFVRSLNY